MSQIPPASGGWTDPYGTVHPGFPPTGYWQASDGRWYPPESRPAEPFAQAEPQSPHPFDPPEALTVAVAPPQISPLGPQPGFGPPGFAIPPGQPGFSVPPGQPGFGAPPGAPGPYGSGGPYGGPASAPSPYGVPSPYGGPTPLGQPFGGFPPAKSPSSRTGLWIVLGVVGLLFVSCGAALVASLGNTEDPVVPANSTTVATRTTGLPVTTTAVNTSDSVGSGGLFGYENGLADVASCTRLDDYRVAIDITNGSKSIANYYLTVVLQDTPGQRLADTSAYINDLAPGEHAVEVADIFEAQGKQCEVIQADRLSAETDLSALGDVSACKVNDPDSLGSVTASVTVTNSATVNNDYAVTVAVYDGKGLRRGSGLAFIETVRPGEAAPGDAYTSITYAKGYTCKAVGVQRTAS
jgi:hypothetical protein